ncbi:MAG: metallophosphoesterase [Deltaproteobacteria bacterium]|nr:metallophosphoesterase [Deltaproteobacteria bacterium]
MPATFLIFFAVVLLLYGAANLYVLRRVEPALPQRRWILLVFRSLFGAWALAFLVGRVLEQREVCTTSKVLVWAGSLWLGLLVYALLASVLVDLLALANRLRPFLPVAMAHRPLRTRRAITGALGAVAALPVVAGYLNAREVRLRTLELVIDKPAGALSSLNVVVASDIHLGTIVGRSRFSRMVEAINAQSPDLVLLVGDIIDEDLKPVIEEDLGETLRDLRARYGVFGVTGNHEYIGGVAASVAYLEEHGVRMLRDATAEVAGGLWLVGREDVSAPRFGFPERRPLSDLMTSVDRTRPVILMDHQPWNFDPAQEAKVDLQLSGHTHDGQLWPFALITRAVYERSWGLERRGSTWFYVSCGAGTWGPPVRLGNEPEIVLMKLRFRQ